MEQQQRLEAWVEGLQYRVFQNMWEARARLGEQYLTRNHLRGYLVKTPEARAKMMDIGAVYKETVYIVDDKDKQHEQRYYVLDELAWMNEKV